MKYKELPALRPGNQPQPILYCRACGGEYSANPADNLWGDLAGESDSEIDCGQCGGLLELVDKRVSYTPVLTMMGRPDKRRGPKPKRPRREKG